MSAVSSASKNTSPSPPVRSKAIPSDLRNHVQQSSAHEGAELTPKSLSQTGRSKTAPVALHTLWTSFINQPQLSERDSIFATTYVPTDSPASSPCLPPRPEGAIDNEPEESIPDMAASPIRRLIEPPLLRQHHSSYSSSIVSPPFDHHPLPETIRHDMQSGPNLPFHNQRGVFAAHVNSYGSRRAGMEHADIDNIPPPFMSPVVSPAQRPSTPHDNDSNKNASKELPADSDERLRYRSWREGGATLSGGGLAGAHRSRSGESSHVDKKIEATLPNVEQPLAVRSRKASHYLRLFKENDAAEEQKRREERVKDRHMADKLAHGYQEDFGVVSVSDNASVDNTIKTSQYAQALQKRSSATSEDIISPETSARCQITDLREVVEANTKASTGNVIKRESMQEFPLKLFEETRNHDNLTPGAERGTSFSRSLPTAASETSRASSARANPTSPLRGLAEYFPVVRDESEEPSPASEDESEREQISSALYFPHRQISPEQLAAEQEVRKAEFEGSWKRKATITSAGKVPKGWDGEETVKTPQEVEISLQSQDENQCLHGDLQATASLSEDEFQKHITSPTEVPASTSESDYESLTGSLHSSNGYESSATDDIGSTPTAAPIRQTERNAHRNNRPQAPLGAVELKPYDHQVGGHTTVYRFSRRAVCKQLNNRENEFYETVERHHPELLEFLPRYDQFCHPFHGLEAETSAKTYSPSTAAASHEYACGLTLCSFFL